MISKFYEDFKVRDYLDDDENFCTKKKLMDCSLGTNPFLKGKYIDPEYNKLKSKLINVLNEDMGVILARENISFGSGTMGIIRNVCDFVIEPGNVVLGIAPQFSRFISEVELKRGTYKYYPMNLKNRCKFSVNEFIKIINEDINMIYIDNPNNPTGQVIKIDDINRICRIAKKYGIIVLIDEAYGDYMKPSNSSINLVNKYDNLIVIKSASKVYGLPSERVGYIVSSKKIIEIYDKVLVPFPISEISSKLFYKALKKRKNIMKKTEKIQKMKKYILDRIGAEKYLYTDADTPIFTVKSEKYENLSSYLKCKGLLVERCELFDTLDGNYSRIRINKNYKKLEKILKEVL